MNEEYKPITNLWKDSEGYRHFGTLKLSSKIKYDGDDFIPLWEWVKQLQQENKKYKEVIDRAIDYIESKEYEYGDEEQDNYIYDIGFDEVNELLDILKGMK